MAKDMFPMTANSKTFQYKVETQAFSNQFVDIIVPFYGQYEKIADLVSSLMYNTRTNPFRLCLVDDCSPNNSFIETGFEAFPNVKVVRNNQQLGFGASLMVGVEALGEEKRNPPFTGKGGFPWLVFLHSDTLIEEPNWLLYLGQTMISLKGQGIKMVSAMSDNPTCDNPALQAPRNYIPRDDVVLGDDDYLPLYCAMCHRDLFKHIGGGIKPYPYGGYEDRELAARMRAYGFKQAVCGMSWVHHEGDTTMRYMRRKRPDTTYVIQNNQNLYLEDIKKLPTTTT